MGLTIIVNGIVSGGSDTSNFKRSNEISHFELDIQIDDSLSDHDKLVIEDEKFKVHPKESDNDPNFASGEDEDESSSASFDESELAKLSEYYKHSPFVMAQRAYEIAQRVQREYGWKHLYWPNAPPEHIYVTQLVSNSGFNF